MYGRIKQWYQISYINGNARYSYYRTAKTIEGSFRAKFINKKKGKISNQRVEKILHEISFTAGVTKRCTVHLFRKTLATQLYHKGVDIAMIARILGHASIKTTEKYYLTLCDTDVKYAYYKCA